MGRPPEHGNCKHPLFYTWSAMLKRCHNPNDHAYADYGGRGIFVCDRWRHSFEYFASDMGPKPSSFHSLDRINNDGGYSPDNCRWATRKEQAGNKRTNLWIEHGGHKMILADWAVRLNVKPKDIWKRLKRGWSIRDAIEVPFRLKSKTDVAAHRLNRGTSHSEKYISIGATFGSWTVMALLPRTSTKPGVARHYECVCVCGGKKSVRGTHLISGSSRSCFKCSIRMRDERKATLKHGHGIR